MRNSISCHVVADYFLLRVDPIAGDAISNLKLQKLCYYAQAWSLALLRSPLYSERIEAWAHGPVIPALYGRFRKYGWQSIDPTELRTDPLAQLSDREKELLDAVWDRYGKLSGRELEELTHQEAPWKNAYGDRLPGTRCDTEITQADMTQFYSKMSKRHAANTGTAST